MEQEKKKSSNLGGARPGAGRKPGKRNQSTVEMLKLLEENKELLINRAVALATHRTRPNTTILAKLLDKILPTLSSADVKAHLNVDPLEEFTEDDLEQLITRLNKS
jgi:hypothetical protein